MWKSGNKKKTALGRCCPSPGHKDDDTPRAPRNVLARINLRQHLRLVPLFLLITIVPQKLSGTSTEAALTHAECWKAATVFVFPGVKLSVGPRIKDGERRRIIPHEKIEVYDTI